MELQRNEYTRYAWAGGTFFLVVLLCQFLVLVGNRFWFYIHMYLEYHTVVVFCQFLCFWREIVYGTYVLTIQLWCCISFFFLAGNSFCGITFVHSVQYSCVVVFLKNDYSVSLF
jgi:hypothetical protein